MHKKVISFIVLFTFLFSVTLGSCTMLKVSATPSTLHVYPGQSIQAAINAADLGDTIQVASGFYNENIVVNKSVSLIGENPSNTFIDGSGTGADTVRVTANNVRIEGFTIQKGSTPLVTTSFSLRNSKGHIITNNIVRQSSYGLRIENSSENYITNNVIANNTQEGIHFSKSSRNTLTGNLIENNPTGAWLADGECVNNTFYHNNFIHNTGLYQARSAAPTTKWDNGAEGNFWSDYNGTDTNGDGIGDTSDCGEHACIPHLGLDFFPLIEEWSETRYFAPYHTTIQCNSTVASFTFNDSPRQISFNIVGPNNTVSFCNVTVDKSLLNGTLTVLVDGVSIEPDLKENSTHTSLYFTISHSVRKIQIGYPAVTDYTSYYIFAGITTGALILGVTLFLSKKKRKSFSSSKITK